MIAFSLILRLLTVLLYLAIGLFLVLLAIEVVSKLIQVGALLFGLEIKDFLGWLKEIRKKNEKTIDNPKEKQ